METERLRSAQQQAERLLEAREKAHRQKVKGLEEQVRMASWSHKTLVLQHETDIYFNKTFTRTYGIEFLYYIDRYDHVVDTFCKMITKFVK